MPTNTQCISDNTITVSRNGLSWKQSPIYIGLPMQTSPQTTMDVTSRFGLRLRQLRRDGELTQLRMATDFGIDRSFISDVERGRKAVSLPMLEVMALGFNLTLSELLQNI